MRKTLSVLLALVLVFGLLPVNVLASYTDVQGNAAYAGAVDRVTKLGVMVGVGDGEFAPDRTVTRAQAITAIGRLAGAEQKKTTDFSDVVSNSWYSGYVGWAVENGYVEGDGNGRFKPDELVTSAHLNLMLSRYAESQGAEVSLPDTGAKTVTRGELAQRIVTLLDALPGMPGCSVIKLKEINVKPGDADYYAKAVEAELYNYRLIRSVPTAYDAAAYDKYYTLAKNSHVDTLDAASLTDRDKTNLDNVIAARQALVQVKPAEEVKWYIWGNDIATFGEVKDSDFADGAIWDNSDFVPFMVPYLLKDQSKVKGNLIAVAGGGFAQRNNDVEGYPIAKAFNERGWNVFVLQRRVAPYSKENAYLDMQRGIRYLRNRIDTDGLGGGDMIAAAGFSGGGGTVMGQINNLYGSIQPTVYDACYKTDAIDKINADLDVAFPIYGSSTVNTENPNLPAMFLGSGMDDSFYPSDYATMAALKEKGIKTEMHTFAYTGHGFGTGTGGTNSTEWVEMADNFVDQLIQERSGAQIPEPYTKAQEYHVVMTNGGPMDMKLGVNDDETMFYLIWTAFGDLQIVYGTMSDWTVTSVDFDRVGFFGQDAQEILDAADKSAGAWTPTGNTGVADSSNTSNTTNTSGTSNTSSKTYSDIKLKEIGANPGSADYYAKAVEAELYNYRLIRSVPTAFDPATYNAYYTLAKNSHVDTLDAAKLSDRDKANLDSVIAARKALVQVKPAKDVMWYIWGSDIATAGEAVKDSDFAAGTVWDNSDFVPFMVPYLLKDQSAVKGNLIAVAGGGFSQRNNDVEGYPIAEAFNELGWNVFVLQRRVAPYSQENAYLDMQRGIRYLRNRIETDDLGGADMIAATGFSGGGMTIIGQINNLYGDIQPAVYDADYKADAIDKINADLDVALPIYGSGEIDTKNPNLPAMFFASGMDDSFYPRDYAAMKMLDEMDVKTEMHTFAYTGHGFGTGTGGTNSTTWIKQADRFVDQLIQERSGPQIPAEYTKSQEYHIVMTNGGPMDMTLYVNETETKFYLVWTAFGDLQIVEGTMSDWTVTEVTFDRVGFFGQDAQEILDAADKSASAWTKR